MIVDNGVRVEITGDEKMKIALYRMGSHYEIPCEVAEWREKDSNYLRMTEPVEVEFRRRNPEEIVPAQLAILDTEREELVAKFTAALKAIDDRRAELLALSAPESVS